MGSIKSSMLIAASICLSFSNAQNNGTSNSTTACGPEIEFKDGYNATGSLATPGFRVNESYPASTWTWSQYIVDFPINSTEYSIWKKFGLKTDPVLNLSDASLPYTGCMIAPLVTKFDSKSEKDDGTCSTVFSSDCLEEIQANLQTSASSQAGRPETVSPCANLLSFSVIKGSKCKGAWDEYFTAQNLPKNFNQSQSMEACQGNPGNSDVTSAGFPNWGNLSATGPNDFTAYDAAIKFPQPLFVMMWLKDTTNGSGLQISSASPPWWDIRIMCLPGNTTVAGSRNITDAVAIAGRVEMSLIGVVGLAALTGWLL